MGVVVPAADGTAVCPGDGGCGVARGGGVDVIGAVALRRE